MSMAAQENTAKTNGHYPNREGNYHPHLSIAHAMPNGPSSPRPSSQNYGWMVAAIIWSIGCIFAAGVLYNSVFILKEDSADQKVQVAKLYETVTRIDERQNFNDQVLQEIRNDVKGIRREQR